MKKLSAVIVSLTMLFMSAPVSYAYELPHSFWAMNDGYQAAISANDNSQIINYGTQIVNLIKGEPQNEQTDNIMASRTYEVAFASYFTGDFKNAAKYFEMSIPYAQRLNSYDAQKIAKNFVKQLTPRLDVYVETDVPQKTYGVKNEPNGVLYGEVSERTTADESMILLYLEYGDLSTNTMNWARKIFKDAKAQNKAVELALNFYEEGDRARSITANDEYLSALYSFLNSFSDVPVYLRIGAEMNIWSNAVEPADFINAFRIVAGRFKGLLNVSTVWSVGHTSPWNVNENDFYPGDEYVDWVGINCYPQKYFGGQRWEGKSVFNEVCFKTGYSADPVIMIEDIVNTYGDRKPIMIVEGGAAYRTNGSINENHVDWAAAKLREMYANIPMVYPQVKLMAYFNTQIANEVNYFNLTGAAELQNEYDRITKSGWFIQNNKNNTASVYFKKLDAKTQVFGDTTVGTYAHIYGSDKTTVDYYLDGNKVASSDTVPYLANIGAVSGTHTLKVVATASTGVKEEKSYTLEGARILDTETGFYDTQSLSGEQKQALNYVVEQGIIKGYDDTTVRPNNSVTRAEFVTMITRLMKYNTDTDCTFDDAKSHWATKNIAACVGAGAINGIGNNLFAPDNSVLYEQAVKITSVCAKAAKGNEVYPDGFLEKAENGGLLNGLSDKTVGSSLKRIDAAMLMYNAIR